MGTGSFPGVKCGRGVLLTTHPLLVPRSWKGRAIPLPPPLGHNQACNGVTLLFYLCIIYTKSFTLLQYVNQRLQIQLELLMMSGMPLETCWAFSERWNNKFYYKVASCWLFLVHYCWRPVECTLEFVCAFYEFAFFFRSIIYSGRRCSIAAFFILISKHCAQKYFKTAYCKYVEHALVAWLF